MAGESRTTVYGHCASDFVEDRLSNLCDPNAGIQTGPFGSQLHREDYVAAGTPIITVEHLGENRILHDGVPFVSDEDKGRLSKYTLRKGDIVFSRVGSVRANYILTQRLIRAIGRCVLFGGGWPRAHRLGGSPMRRRIAAPRGSRRNGSNSGWLAKP
jgi:hypothetical protein